MDFIQKAIDRAREQRSHPLPGESRARVVTDAPAPHDFEYTQTKVVNISPARLRQQRVIAGLD